MDFNVSNVEDQEDILEIPRTEFDALNPPRRVISPVSPSMRDRSSSAIEELTSVYLANVLAVVHDVQPAFVTTLIQQQLLENPGNVLGVVINLLIDNPNYPKVEVRGGKRKRSDSDHDAGSSGKGKQKQDESKRPKVDWVSTERVPPSEDYQYLARKQLEQDFRYVSRKYIHGAFADNNRLYFPTYFHLKRNINDPNFGASKKVPTSPSKGKEKGIHCADFDAERKAVEDVLGAENQVVGPSASATGVLILGVAEDEGVECQCCFEQYASTNLVQCPESHLFCKNCARRTAEQAIGQRSASIRCMDLSGCGLDFTEEAIRSFLGDKAMMLLESIRTERAILDANLEGLKDCPFCEFKCIIENDQERLFHCKNHQCGIVSCLQCKRKDHLPKTCEEVTRDRNLDGCHAIAEAMTDALTRKCPTCQTAFVKISGCNRMTCSYCNTDFCYTCRKIVTGYEHFDKGPGRDGRRATRKCPLYDDDLDKRHRDEVAAAARTAAAKQQEENPDMDAAALAAELSAAGPSHRRRRRARPVYEDEDMDDYVRDRSPLLCLGRDKQPRLQHWR